MTRIHNRMLAAALLLGATGLAAGAALASGFDGLRHHAAQRGTHSLRLAGPGRPSCLIRQINPDGTVVFIDRCAQESAAKRPAIG